ncbi:MAG: thiamine pyrophosphate-dependent dehydrogenase E1 component subunit alpha [Myxococcales bacterium]|nr:thiamine pyrophosphate-dependent dehydrogenase E1 component subunit alpha [Myxococcales bacterium]
MAEQTAGTPSPTTLRRAHFFMRLSRAWDSRFESMARAGNIGRWYSAVGNEATTVGAALSLLPNDALSTVHRDLGAILTHYLDPTRLAPALFEPQDRTAWDALRPDPGALLHRLASQVLGRRDGFTRGVDRSFHYGLIDRATGLRHVGMISHLGAMIPVAAGLALANLQDGNQNVVVGFIGEGATSQGDFHEALNMAGVMKLPLILVVENNRYAFSTPLHEQFACEKLSDRAPGYGIAGETFDGTDFEAVHGAFERALARARTGEGATLLEAMLPRMRGHAEGDGSYELIAADERARWLTHDPLPRFEAWLTRIGAADAARIAAVQETATAIIEAAVARGLATPEPELHEAWRNPFAPGPVADAFARQHAEVTRG